MKKKLTFVFYLLLICCTVGMVLVVWCNHVIEKASRGKLYSDVADIPYNQTGLLLGTSKYLSSGYLNPYYQYRIDAAVSLLHAGRIKYLVISGDNSRKTYNEPEMMRADLIERGIDSCSIFLDYAGFRTFDSVVRVKAIFGQTSITVISQPFHNKRAVFIASKENIHAVAFNALDVTGEQGLRVQVREKLARVKVFIDYLVNVQPKFLGEKIIISQ